MQQATSVHPAGIVGDVVLGLRNATKSFGGTVAILQISLDLRAGEVLALLGENGAGKSTCVKLMSGLYRPDSGQVILDGHPAQFRSPLDALNLGVAVVHQHPGLFNDLSIAENIFIGHMPTTRLKRIDRSRMKSQARLLLETLGLACDPERPLSDLRPSEQQIVEIARALSTNARVLILDEPTAALSQREVDRLFTIVSQLRTRGVAMMFVSHRMDEIYRVADRIAVLRDGKHIATEPVAALSLDRAIQLMVGRTLDSLYPKRSAARGAEVLRVTGLSRAGAFEDVTLSIHAGEIIGLGGLVGSGRTEIARVLFGIDRPTRGSIRLSGDEVSFGQPIDAMESGIAYVSEDRLGQSLVMDAGILFNATLPTINQATVAGLISSDKELSIVRSQLERLRLRFKSFDQPVRTLSGGNQQKVVLAKWLATKPRLLILDEPTQGVDIQTKVEVHALIADLAAQGLAILLISSELPELIGMSDRIVVLREGQVRAVLSQEEATQERILVAATDATLLTPQIERRSAGHRRFRPRSIRKRRRFTRSDTCSCIPGRCHSAQVVCASRTGLDRSNPCDRRTRCRNQPAHSERAQSHPPLHGRRIADDRCGSSDARYHHPKHRPFGRLCDRPDGVWLCTCPASSSGHEHLLRFSAGRR
jgi:rhamnose transport system ATP-binding protein